MSILQKLTDIIRDTIKIDTHIDTAAAERSIRSNIEFKGPNAWILAVAVIIASVGLNVNSIPVVIGAMLISPLMGPIFGLGLGLGVSDIQLMKSSGKNLLVMVSIKPSVYDVSITKGRTFNRDSISGNAIISIVVSSYDTIAKSELDELTEWLKVRLDTDGVEVSQH